MCHMGHVLDIGRLCSRYAVFYSGHTIAEKKG